MIGSPTREVGDPHDRLERARGLLRRLEDGQDHGDRARPTPDGDGDGRTVPVPAALAALLPGGGLRRGSAVSVAAGSGAWSLVFALLAGVTAEGMWAGVVGHRELGAVAAAEAGVRLERLAMVPEPGMDLVPVTAALLDGMDLVAVVAPERSGVRPTDRQRLAARARQRGAVLLAVGPWPGADLRLHGEHRGWEGTDAGAGRLRARRMLVRAHGRGTGAAGRDVELLLPGPRGTVTVPPRAQPPAIPSRPAGTGHRPRIRVAG